jgi:hypothetical protein
MGSQGAQGAIVVGAQGVQGSQGVQGTASGVQGTTGGSGTPSAGLVLVQSQYVTGSAVSSLTFDNLDGDTHKNYLLISRIYLPSGVGAGGATLTVTLRPNGLTTGVATTYRSSFGASSSQGSWALAHSLLSAGATSYGLVTTNIAASTGKPRLIKSNSSWYSSGVAALVDSESATRWSDTSTNITSLVIYGDISNASQAVIGVNSEFHLYRYEV